MKYFNPSYWFKLWLLSAPLFNDKTQGINAKSIDNKKIKDWASNNTTDISLIENQELNLSNNQTNLIMQQQIDNVDHFYENFLKTQGWSKDPQIADQQLQEIQKEHHQFLKEQHEIYKRQSNRQNWAISLNVPNVIQVGSVYCGPAVAESVLRHLGLNVETFLNNVNAGRTNNIYINIQHYIASRLEINVVNEINNPITGTLPYRLNDIINEILRSQNLNSLSYLTEWFRTPRYFGMNPPLPINEVSPQRAPGYTQLETLLNFQYGLIERLETPLNRGNGIIMEIERNFREDFIRNLNLLVRSSLRNNMPVIFAQAFQPSARVYGHIGRHFVLIDSIGPENNDHQEEIIYRFMDPGTGVYSNHNALDLYYRGGDVFALTFFDSNRLLIENQIPIAFPNVGEPMEIGSYSSVVNQLILPIISHTILFALVFLNFERNRNCNRETREVTNVNYWHEKFCDLKPQIEKIQGKITAIKVLDENTKGENLKEGDILLGTTEGLYLIRQGDRIDKFDNLNYSIKDIILDKKNEIYFLSHSGEVINLKININMLKNNILSSTISSITIFNSKLEQIKILSIKEITKNSNDNYLKEGDIYAWTDDGGYLIRNRDLFGKIDINKHYIIHHDDNHIEEVHYNHNDNTYCHSTGKKIAAVSTATAIGATTGSIIPGIGTLIGAAVGGLIGGIGAVFITAEGCGYKLKREIFDINNLKEKNELKNLKKWTNEFTKSINHEQHLAIDNKPNFSTSNLTSL